MSLSVLYFSYVYDGNLSDYYESIGEVWCIQRAYVRLIGLHDDVQEAWEAGNNTWSSLPDDHYNYVGCIPLCHDEHNLV